MSLKNDNADQPDATKPADWLNSNISSGWGWRACSATGTTRWPRAYPAARLPLRWGVIEGAADGVSTLFQIWSGWYSDRIHKRKGLAVLGYSITTLSKATFASRRYSRHTTRIADSKNAKEATMKLTVLTYDTLFTGRDGSDDGRAQAQIGLINDAKPDVFLMQEAKGFDVHGAWLYALEQKIGMRGFLTIAPRSGLNAAIFIRELLRPVSFEADDVHFHHVLATFRVALPDSDQQITFISAHLCPNGPEVCRREAAYLAVQAAPDKLTLLTGDFNSVSPHDPEPEAFDVLAAYHRAHYLAYDLRTADGSVLAHLEAAGWVDVGHARGGSSAPTVPMVGFTSTEFATMRCEYLLASQALAAHAQSYRVIRNEASDMASDHYPVLATFEVPL